MNSLRERIDKLISRGWTEEEACNYIERSIAEGEPDDDDWFMVFDRKKGEWVDLRLEE